MVSVDNRKVIWIRQSNKRRDIVNRMWYAGSVVFCEFKSSMIGWAEARYEPSLDSGILDCG